MRALILALTLSANLAGAAHAAGCSGNGSQNVLTIKDWAMEQKDTAALAYRVDEAKSVTVLYAHVYFASATDEILGDAPLHLEAPDGIAPMGMANLVLPKPMLRRLAAAATDAVTLFACTNYMEYADGSMVIID